MYILLTYLPIVSAILFFLIFYLFLLKSPKRWTHIGLGFVIITSLIVLITRHLNGMIGCIAHIFMNWWIWLTLIFWIPAKYIKKNWLKIFFRIISGIFFALIVFTVVLDVLVDYNLIYL